MRKDSLEIITLTGQTMGNRKKETVNNLFKVFVWVYNRGMVSLNYYLLFKTRNLCRLFLSEGEAALNDIKLPCSVAGAYPTQESFSLENYGGRNFFFYHGI